jgi:hypothetical protein
MSKEFNDAIKYVAKNPSGDSTKLLGKIGFDNYVDLKNNNIFQNNEFNSRYALTEEGVNRYNLLIQEKKQNQRNLIQKLAVVFSL